MHKPRLLPDVLRRLTLLRLGLVLLVLTQAAVAQSVPGPWKFGVIADTQWTVADDGYNPNTVAAGIIQPINQEFIRHGVKLVITTGDMANVCSAMSLDTRALYCQDLYNAGIGFYPVRGNHEAYWGSSAPEVVRVFPQVQNGTNNVTPADVMASGYGHDLYIDPAAKTGEPFVIGANFSSPALVNSNYGGFSYSFDYQNVRFVLIDQFEVSDYTINESSLSAQQPWITQLLADPNRPRQAFVFGHKPLLGIAHKDNLFGAPVSGTDPGDGSGVVFDPGFEAQEQAYLETKQRTENAFINSLAMNQVRLYVCGHDHAHYDSVVTCPDGSASIHQLISQSDSSKFYSPWAVVSTNDAPVAEDPYQIGYSIYTVDGPRVTVDYYYAEGVDATSGYILTTPVLTGNWRLRRSFGYSLNGREFLVPQGGSYAGIADDTRAAMAFEPGFTGTSMRIFSGVNASTAISSNGKSLMKALNTGWAPAPHGALSDQLLFWGLADNCTPHCDTIVLALSFDPARVTDAQAASGLFCLASPGPCGSWVKAVALNRGGTEGFVNGPWLSRYPLGAYGVDKAAGIAWAVVNHPGPFAIVQFPPPLTLTQTTGYVVLTWSASLAPDCQLQFCPNLEGASWITLSTNRVHVGPQGFFRLIRP